MFFLYDDLPFCLQFLQNHGAIVGRVFLLAWDVQFRLDKNSIINIDSILYLIC